MPQYLTANTTTKMQNTIQTLLYEVTGQIYKIFTNYAITFSQKLRTF